MADFSYAPTPQVLPNPFTGMQTMANTGLADAQTQGLQLQNQLAQLQMPYRAALLSPNLGQQPSAMATLAAITGQPAGASAGPAPAGSLASLAGA